MSNEGSGDTKQGGPGAEQQEGRPRTRSRRRRSRRGGNKRQESAENRPEAGGPPAAEQPAEAKDTKSDPNKPAKSRRRDRSRRKGPKSTGAPGEEAGRPRGEQESGADGSRSRTHPDGGARPEPRGTPRARPEGGGPAASLPPAAEAGETRPGSRRGQRRSKRDDGSKARGDRSDRGGRGAATDARPPQPARWSQAPPAIGPAPARTPRQPAKRPSAPPPPPPREPGPPVFLPDSPDGAFDEAIAIDMTPWEAGIELRDVDGTLYNSVVVRGLRTNRSREYDAGDGLYEPGDLVAIEGDGGSADYGTVVRRNRRQVLRGRLPRVLRRAQASEMSAETRDKRREQEVYGIARHAANALNLPIKIVRAQAEPNGKTVVFFASEDRIDFRELFRRVSAAAQGRVELRQLGVRDAAKMLGGIAPCGLQLCCSSFLRDFAPVSIKMAKEQGLVLNPQRVSGLCGRLLCCLTYEDALYRAQRKLLPKLGKRVLTARGPGKVRDVDVLAQTIRISLETGEIVTMTPADITPMFPSQRTAELGATPREERADGRPRRSRSTREARPRDDAPPVAQAHAPESPGEDAASAPAPDPEPAAPHEPES